MVITYLYEPMVYADGSAVLPKDYVLLHDPHEPITGWVAYNPRKKIPWIDDMNYRCEGHPLVMVREDALGTKVQVITNIKRRIEKLPAKEAPEGLIEQDGALETQIYTAQYALNKMAKVHGRKRGDGSSAGIFIPLPKHLARKFPSLHPQDGSPSHVTLMILGEIKDPEQQATAVTTIQNIMKSWWPTVEASLGDLAEFHHEDKTVQHLQVSFDRDMTGLRLRLRQALEDAGIPVDTRFASYQPHVTLQYSSGDPYKGRKPKGTWKFDRFEIWGLPKVYRIPFGEEFASHVRSAYLHKD